MVLVSRWGRGINRSDWSGRQFCCHLFGVYAFWQERRFLPSLVQQELVIVDGWAKKVGLACTTGARNVRSCWPGSGKRQF